MGKFIRFVKIDELPQLLNILLGDMSFVGPRPEIKEYEKEHQAIINSTLLKRQGETDDIADSCIFLINNANYIAYY